MNDTQNNCGISACAALLGAYKGQAWIKDHAFQFRYANPAFADSVASTSDNLCGLHDLELFSRKRVGEFRDSDRAASRQAGAIVVYEQGTRERQRTFETIKLPIRDQSGRTVAVVGLSGDVTESRVVEQAGPAAAAPTTQPAWLEDAITRLRSVSCASPRISRLAAEVGVHEDTLGREFRARFNLTIIEYRSWTRARAARDDVLGTARSLADIAATCGYSDQSHMTHDFKRYFGLSPGTFRKIARYTAG